MDAQELVAEVSSELKEDRMKKWELQILETEVNKLKDKLRNLQFDRFSKEELQSIKTEKERIGQEADRLLHGMGHPACE